MTCQFGAMLATDKRQRRPPRPGRHVPMRRGGMLGENPRAFSSTIAPMSDEFEQRLSFEPGEMAANVRLGKLEMMYEELFAEVIEDGIITQEERQKLDKMAESL